MNETTIATTTTTTSNKFFYPEPIAVWWKLLDYADPGSGFFAFE